MLFNLQNFVTKLCIEIYMHNWLVLLHASEIAT